MRAFTFLINGKEDFSAAMELVRPEWMKLRGPRPDISRDFELMQEAAKNVSTPKKKVTIKGL